MKKALSVILICCLISSCSYRVYPGRREVQAKQAEEPFSLTLGQETVIGITVVAGLLAVRYLVLRMMTAETALNEVKTELKARGEEIKGLGKAFAVRGRQLETKTKELATVQREKEGLIRANADLRARLLTQEELEEVRRQLTEVRKEKEDLEGLEEELFQAKIDLTEEREEVKRLSKKLATAQQKQLDLQTQLEARLKQGAWDAALQEQLKQVSADLKDERRNKAKMIESYEAIQGELLQVKSDLRKEQEKTLGLQRELERMKKTLAEKEAVQAEKEPEGKAVPPAEAEIAVTNPAAEAEAADRKEEPASLGRGKGEVIKKTYNITATLDEKFGSNEEAMRIWGEIENLDEIKAGDQEVSINFNLEIDSTPLRECLFKISYDATITALSLSTKELFCQVTELFCQLIRVGGGTSFQNQREASLGRIETSEPIDKLKVRCSKKFVEELIQIKSEEVPIP